jgi:hypothetical protein
MSGPEFLYLIFGLVLGAIGGYGLRAYRSRVRRERYRRSTSYHVLGEHQGTTNGDRDAKDRD